MPKSPTPPTSPDLPGQARRRSNAGRPTRDRDVDVLDRSRPRTQRPSTYHRRQHLDYDFTGLSSPTSATGRLFGLPAACGGAHLGVGALVTPSSQAWSPSSTVAISSWDRSLSVLLHRQHDHRDGAGARHRLQPVRALRFRGAEAAATPSPQNATSSKPCCSPALVPVAPRPALVPDTILRSLSPAPSSAWHHGRGPTPRAPVSLATGSARCGYRSSDATIPPSPLDQTVRAVLRIVRGVAHPRRSCSRWHTVLGAYRRPGSHPTTRSPSREPWRERSSGTSTTDPPRWSSPVTSSPAP